MYWLQALPFAHRRYNGMSSLVNFPSLHPQDRPELSHNLYAVIDPLRLSFPQLALSYTNGGCVLLVQIRFRLTKSTQDVWSTANLNPPKYNIAYESREQEFSQIKSNSSSLPLKDKFRTIVSERYPANLASNKKEPSELVERES
ncbi:hypothetical protein CDAR_595941 [Caerostris darwini]|uniref:Uncharacterized protein n=1 Tax=Caerostris darwini TaxID=1538125 RepID=A0AAV4Q8G3_9ARAC|nr:hypothetical protein CDAR_595941 [Caerostris darwini]